jgi:hypothetical protein
MSWTAKATVDRDAIEEAVFVGVQQTEPEGSFGAYTDQLAAAQEAAAILAKAVGGARNVSITATGHANPDHILGNGYSNEFINIQVCIAPD